jgi:hypothetical protein
LTIESAKPETSTLGNLDPTNTPVGSHPSYLDTGIKKEREKKERKREKREERKGAEK